MKTIFTTLAAALVPVLLTSCTGDPNSGGIFWSESQAQQRLSDRQRTLDNIEGDTGRTRASSRQKQREIDRLRSQQ